VAAGDGGQPEWSHAGLPKGASPDETARLGLDREHHVNRWRPGECLPGGLWHAEGRVGRLDPADRHELAGAGITASCVAPGPIDTPFKRAHHPADTRAESLRTIPARRYGEADEVAEAVAFLCGEHTAYITGQTLAVDGGFLAAGLLRSLVARNAHTTSENAGDGCLRLG